MDYDSCTAFFVCHSAWAVTQPEPVFQPETEEKSEDEQDS